MLTPNICFTGKATYTLNNGKVSDHAKYKRSSLAVSNAIVGIGIAAL